MLQTIIKISQNFGGVIVTVEWHVFLRVQGHSLLRCLYPVILRATLSTPRFQSSPASSVRLMPRVNEDLIVDADSTKGRDTRADRTDRHNSPSFRPM